MLGVKSKACCEEYGLWMYQVGNVREVQGFEISAFGSGMSVEWISGLGSRTEQIEGWREARYGCQ